jgi:hypothetical protein
MSVLIGTPVHRKGAYVLDKFLDNQKQIQSKHNDCDLVFSTDDPSFVDELKRKVELWALRGTVISFKVDKPDYAKSRLWSIAAGRESIRQYFLSYTQADRLLFLDADMTFDPEVLVIMEKEIKDHDVVFSGYRFRNGRLGLTGAGCLLLRKHVLEKIKFRCFEFKNGQVINEDNVAELDMYRRGCRIKKGFFLAIEHYDSPVDVKSISPQKVNLYRKTMTSAFLRFCLIGASVVIHYNIASKGQRIVWRFLSLWDKYAGINK